MNSCWTGLVLSRQHFLPSFPRTSFQHLESSVPYLTRCTNSAADGFQVFQQPGVYARTVLAMKMCFFGADAQHVLNLLSVLVFAGGASAFDNAQHALSLGVGQVEVFVRRDDLPRTNPIRYMEQVGFLKHFSELDDATKYKGIKFFMETNQPPTNDTFNRQATKKKVQLCLHLCLCLCLCLRLRLR